jgi:hypothetical protein
VGQLADLAENHWKRWFPDQYAQIKDKPRFFQGIEDEASEQIAALEDALAGNPPEGESFQDRLARMSLARSNAEAQVMREIVLPDPEHDPLPNPDPANPPRSKESPADRQLVEALAAFQDAAREYEQGRNPVAPEQ